MPMSIPPGGGGGGGDKPKNIVDFIGDQDFMDSVIGGHCYDHTEEEKCNVDDLREIVKRIISGASLFVHKDSSDRKNVTDAPLPTMPSDISHLIDWIYRHGMTCEAMHGQIVRGRLQGIFDELQMYQWTTQVLLVLAAFALQYGHFWCASEAPIEGTCNLSTYLLRGLNSLKKKIISDGKKKAAVGRLDKVVNELWELTDSLLDLCKLVIDYRTKHVPELAKAFRQTPGWSCEIIIAILATGHIFAQIIGVDKLAESELGTLEWWVLHRKITVQAELQDVKDEIGLMEEYQKYAAKVEAPVDIAYFLRSLLAKDSSPDPIITDPNGLPVKYEFFRKKNVLLIISDHTISGYDAATLEKIHEYRLHFHISKRGCPRPVTMEIQTEWETPYQLVWIPIVDEAHQEMEELPSESVGRWALRVDSHKINSFAAKYIKEEWGFKRETMVVVVDSIGWVENTDAMPMLRIHGRRAFPFTRIEAAQRWKSQYQRWLRFVLEEPVVQQGTLDAIETEYTLFYGGTGATKSEADVVSGISNLHVVPIEDTKLFFLLLRSCLIFRLQSLQIVDTDKNPLHDDIVYQMCEAYKAFQRGGVAIITKGTNLLVQHIGLLSDLKLVREHIGKNNGWSYIAESFKRYNDIQGRSICLGVCIPDFPGLGDLYCPSCDRFKRWDLNLMCCHDDDDDDEEEEEPDYN